PRRRAAGGHPDRVVGQPQLPGRGVHRRGLGRADRADHDDLLRHGAHDRPEGLRRGDPRRHGELSAGRGRRRRGRAARVLLVVLGQRAEGVDRLHADHSGAGLALAHVASSRRGRGRVIRKHRALALFLAVVALAPLALPAFYVTLLNYVGLATLVTL